MARNEVKIMFEQLPFHNSTVYDVENEFKSAKARIQKKMSDYRLENFMRDNYLADFFNPVEFHVYRYFTEDEYIRLRRN